MKIRKEDQLVRINSYSLSLVLASSFIANCLTAANVYHDGIIPLVTFGSISVIFICNIIFGLKSKIKIKILSLFMFVYIGLFFLISNFMAYEKSYYYIYLSQFIFFGGTAFIYSALQVDFEKTLRGMSLITLLVFINPVKIIAYFIVSAFEIG